MLQISCILTGYPKVRYFLIFCSVITPELVSLTIRKTGIDPIVVFRIFDDYLFYMTKVERLFDVAYYARETYNLEHYLSTKYNGKWQAISNKNFIETANQISKYLLSEGIVPGDKVALITTANRTEWNLMDQAVLQIGAHTVPIYPTVSEEEMEYIFNHSEAKIAFVSDEELYRKTQKIKPKLSFLGKVYSFDKIDGVVSIEEAIKQGSRLTSDDEVGKLREAVKPDDLASIIYTSGTTGKPKGVMLSHHNIIANFMGCQDRVPLHYGKDKALSFLPCCHVYERMLLYLYQYGGISIYFAESIDKIAENINEVKPNVMCVVPRLLEKVYDKIIEKGSKLSGIQKKIFFWAVNIGEQYPVVGSKNPFYSLQLKLAQKLVLRKWKEGLGGQLDLIVSGSAPLQPRLARIFSASGMLVMEGYGLTETSPVIAVNSIVENRYKIGTVGMPLSNVEVKIAEDGEILTKSPCVMLGYYKDEQKTAEVIKDGYFHTEDIGEIDKDGFLRITDRKKEMFKTSGGKYVAPQVIENALKASRFIEQVMVVGEGEKMPAAFIQPDFAFVKAWAKGKGIDIGSTNEDLVRNEAVTDRFKQVIESINKQFGHWEQVKRFELTPQVWSIEGGELTPTLKLKRKQIREKYKNLYAEMYGHE